MDDVKNVIIVGAGGQGRETLEIFVAQNRLSSRWRVLGFVDDEAEMKGRILNGYPVLGDTAWLAENNHENLRCVCAIADCSTRRRVVRTLEEAGIRFCNAIHPSVIASESVSLGSGVIICAGSILTVDIRIGNHVQINVSCAIGHDVVIDDFCTICPASTIGGSDRIGQGVFVGAGTHCLQDVSVGDWSVIGAGAVVIEDIPGNALSVGMPARVVRMGDFENR